MSATTTMATLVVTVLSLSGCGGGGSPTAAPTPPPAPTPTPPPILTFVDGVSDAPLTPQSITPANPRVGDLLTAALDGYMTREQKWTGQRIELWPLPERQDEQRAYQDLVYAGNTARPLLKWSGLQYAATFAPLVPEWAGREQEIKDRLSGVFADVAAAGGPVFSWSSSGLSHPSLTVRVDAADESLQPDYAACTTWWHDGSTITRAEVVFAEPDLALTDSLSMHMMGYAIGLSDWGEPRSVMNPSWNGRAPTFHELERRAVHMMYQHRAAGNLLPDRDPAFTTSASGSGSASRRERRGH